MTQFQLKKMSFKTKQHFVKRGFNKLACWKLGRLFDELEMRNKLFFLCLIAHY